MSPLLTDLYQLNMIQAYLDHGKTDTAVFEFFMRKLPARRGFLIAAGLEQVLDFLEGLRFSADEIDWLAHTGRFGKGMLDHLAALAFTGDVHAMPEGTAFFADEPILRITAPLPQAQLIETRIINILHFQTLVASKAARMRLAAPDKLMVDFGLRRAHGAEAGLAAARASYIAGFAGTATVLADKLYGIPTFGTMAHSFIQAYDDEAVAFEDFALSRPQNLTLLIDTYDTEAGARKVVALAPRLKDRGITIRAVRLDSGDLLGTSMTTSSDVPALDCAYKLQEYARVARRKRSVGKATWPGRKQVWRRYGPDGAMAGDVVSLEDDPQTGEPLLHLVMREGRRVAPPPTLAECRTRARRDLARLPKPLRGLESGATYPVEAADALRRLVAEVDSRVIDR